MKDRNGFPIIEGCLVRYWEYGRGRYGWVLQVLRHKKLLRVMDAERWAKRYVPLSAAVVTKPSQFQQAHAIGMAKTIKHVSEQAKRARGLRPRTST